MQQVRHFLKHSAIKIGLFLRANWAYILWGILHFLVASFILYGFFHDMNASMEFSAIIYAVSIGLAVSPLGELVMRGIERARKVETKRDMEYLLPLFEEVYQEARAKTPSMSKHIKLYITESKDINACAIGRKTVMLTRGAIDSLSPEELKGIIAHELGHVTSGDSLARVITIVGNGFFSVIVLLCKTIMLIFGVIVALKTKKYVLSIVIGFIVNLLFNYSIAAFLFFGNILIALNSRYREYLADDYAYKIGYGDELKETLYQINQLNMGGRQKLKDWLRASHPHTTARIARLERKLEAEQEQE